MRRILIVGALTIAAAMFAGVRITNAVFAYQDSRVIVPVAKPAPAPKAKHKAVPQPQPEELPVCPASDPCAKRMVIMI